jgi:hypothetical protein
MSHRKEKRHPHWPSYARRLKREAKTISETEDRNFAPLIEKAGGIEDHYYRAQSLAWIARRMTDVGGEGDPVFSRAIRAAKKVEQEWRRAEVLVQVASEMTKAGVEDLGVVVREIKDIGDPGRKDEALKIIERRTAMAGISFPKIEASRKTGEKAARKRIKPPTVVPPEEKRTKRITLGLVNTYRGKRLQDAHIRAMARAAPLCWAFNMNLSLFGFPVADGTDAVSRVERESQVGEGGSYLRRLYEEGRLFILEVPGAPESTEVGEIIATTSRPNPKKRTRFEDLATDRPLCILMGLGSQGLPGSILRLSRHHLEITGGDIPLETCTAMGVLAAKLGI